MDFIDISKKRRTVRQFDSRPVEKEKIEKILEAGRWAPTAINAQPQRILVLDSEENLKKVSEFCSFGYNQKYVDLDASCDDHEHGKINLYYGAPLVLFVCYDKEVCWSHPQSGKSSGATDATIVTTHMMLEAASLDLGTVWISFFDEDKARDLLNIPDQWEVVCMLYVGYPAKDYVHNKTLGGHRKPIEDTCFYNKIEGSD